MTDDELDFDSADVAMAADGLDLLDGNTPRRPTISLGQQGFNCRPRASLPLYLDIETVPDDSRLDLFDLPALPEVPPETTSANCPPPETILAGSLEQIERDLLAMNPDDAYLELVTIEEGKRPKGPRAGVATACGKVRSRKREVAGAAAARSKELGLTPEYCRIVAVGWAIGDGTVRSSIVGVSNGQRPNGEDAEPQTEENLLSFIWSLIQSASPIVGYNVLAFDLPVIRARSIILGVEPSRLLNDSPWNNRDVVDLLKCRFSRSGDKAMRLKTLARLYGVPVPAGQVDGSDVAYLFDNDPGKLGAYVRSDVEVTRALHKKWSGYFCV